MSFFESVIKLPEDPIFKLPAAFNNDPRTNKVNLGVGTYRNVKGKTTVFASVKKAEDALTGKETSKEYLPIEGLPPFIQACRDLIFGSNFAKERAEGVFTAQTLGGTGALRLGGDFLVRAAGKRTIYLPQPTWPNHKMVFSYAGMDVRYYRYYTTGVHGLDFNGMCEDIGNLAPGSVVLLHACCHNPTGYDLSRQQWQELSVLIRARKVIPFFDLAYQGFSDAVEEDAFPVRYFTSQGHEMLVASSLSKNFGLYCERVGSLSIVAKDGETAGRIGSQIKQLIRSNYSNPPRHGAQIVADIIKTESLKNEWLEELSGMYGRLNAMRRHLITGLQAKAMAKDWSFLEQQKGFFAFCGFTAEQTDRLVKEYGIYMPDNGRINISGLNESNFEYVIQSISSVVDK